ncbi:hypothetical protein [Bradyrhizobium oligotrophicum]|uniref:hypothetical protein n=1 Tax=Bradyrhizobium oligotrophicum TaxID=44255 RepID=UPI001181C233|nr:hypothetical protein [Bradyrhizobium oligotrophicum]
MHRIGGLSQIKAAAARKTAGTTLLTAPTKRRMSRGLANDCVRADARATKSPTMSFDYEHLICVSNGFMPTDGARHARGSDLA